MAGKRDESSADCVMSDYLAGLGFSVAPRQVRSWRAIKLIPKALRIPQGYAKEVLSVNTEETFSRALIVASVCDGRRLSPSMVVLELFGRHEVVTIEQFRLAFSNELSRTRKKMLTKKRPNRSSAESLGEDFVRHAADTKFGRKLLNNSKEPKDPNDPKDPEDSPESIAATSMSVLANSLLEDLSGEDEENYCPSNAAMEEFISTTGLSGLAEGNIGVLGTVRERSPDELQDDIELYLECSNFDVMIQVVNAATMEDLEWSRKIIEVTMEYARDIADLVDLVGGPANAYGMTMANKIERSPGDVAFQTVQFLSSANAIGRQVMEEGLRANESVMELARFKKMATKVVPIDLFGFLRLDGYRFIEEASAKDLERFRNSLLSLERDYEGITELILKPPQ